MIILDPIPSTAMPEMAVPGMMILATDPNAEIARVMHQTYAGSQEHTHSEYRITASIDTGEFADLPSYVDMLSNMNCSALGHMRVYHNTDFDMTMGELTVKLSCPSDAALVFDKVITSSGFVRL